VTTPTRPRTGPPGAAKDPDAWWTVLVVDPVALRVLPHLVDRRRVTPDGLSLASLAFALAAGVGFLNGWWVAGAVLFELHFVLDCLDGKLARVRGTQNPRGGFVDLACDLVGTSWCFATLGVASFAGTERATLALLPALGHVAYTWSTVWRSRAGGLDADRPRAGGRVGRFLAARRMVPLPYGVEVENVVLFVLPLLGREDLVRAALLLATGFFVVAGGRNVRATYRALS
jgi:phosphatidylglycerophosphate synthase